ncbi:hypothetical protein NHQ30_008939 [Ciborinia camelliae]|nr:hypothetical protein NHQ30_008939 [Ciborinia camelliae]
MSCPASSITVPAAALSSDTYFNACTAVNITSNAAAVSAMSTCCGSAPVNVILEGCYSYCNVTGSTAQQTFEKCFGSSAGVSDVDMACTLDDNPFSAVGSAIPASAGSTYLGGSSGTLVFPSATDSASASASTTGSVSVTTTESSGQATATHASTSASGTEKGSTSASVTAKTSTSSGKTSASATSSSATASSTANAGQPTVKQLSKGGLAILALAFVGLLA